VLANGLALMTGIFLTILGLLRFGFIDNILSKAVLRGFVTAVAFIIMIEQLPALTGIPVPKSTPSTTTDSACQQDLTVFIATTAIEFTYEKAEYLWEHMREVQLFNLGVGVVSVAFLLILSQLKRWVKWIVYFPGILVLVVAGMTMAYVMEIPDAKFPLLGAMPGTAFLLLLLACVLWLNSLLLSCQLEVSAGQSLRECFP
jgi:MFS superfamily sulfate permease-like transporter